MDKGAKMKFVNVLKRNLTPKRRAVARETWQKLHGESVSKGSLSNTEPRRKRMRGRYLIKRRKLDIRQKKWETFQKFSKKGDTGEKQKPAHYASDT